MAAAGNNHREAGVRIRVGRKGPAGRKAPAGRRDLVADSIPSAVLVGSSRPAEAGLARMV